MKRLLACFILICSVGCATRVTSPSSSQSPSPMVVGGSYQVRLTGSANDGQFRVIDRVGDWVRLQYEPTSPLFDGLPDHLWVNSNQIVWVLPIQK